MHKKLLAGCGVSIAAACSLAATICTPSPETSAISSRVDLELSDVVSIRILDKTATTAIDSLDLELVVTPTGAFTSDNFIVETATSNRTGYKLYMSTDFQKGDPAAYTTDLVNQEDDTYTIPTLGTSDVSLADFSQARGSYVNRWGYSLDNLTYDPVPAHDTTEEIGSSSTASAADRTNVYIGVNANMDKISGLYKNTLVFSGVANPIQTDYTLHFLPGTEESVTDLPTDQSVSEISASHTFTIPSTAPSRAGYSFTGYTDGTTTYQPGDSITVLGGEDYTGSATLTAQWKLIPSCTANHICFRSNEPAGLASGVMEDQTIVYMTDSTPTGQIDSRALSGSTTQLTFYSPNWTLTGYGFKGWNTAADGSGTMYGPNETVSLSSAQRTQLGTNGLELYAQWVASVGDMADWSGCNNLAQGSVTALTYGSDTYAVAKLVDGKCWMIENMRTSTNAGTDSETNWTATISDRQYSLTNITGVAGADPVTSGTAAYQWKSYGGYYSWASAANTTTIGTTQYTNWDTNSNSYIAGGSAQGICPTGWRLPRAFTGSGTNDQRSDFRYLQNILTNDWATSWQAADSNKWRKYPNNFIFAGYWGGTTSYGRGSRGGYWTSTVSINNQTYRMFITSNSIAPAYGSGETYEYLGKSVRCVFGS